ncbi:MAG: prephenate dehydrogenase/arogenate dehydrogenase family protein [Candidatus Caenarcaniphilales bacterium]|nr:prephenate dehydrogenase/arogenate dehydrogenase family protein [Candidatus Caenarcaniphilales bacterium]
MLQGKKIGIVGLGLIGGSIEKRLLERQAELGISGIKTVSKSQKREYSIQDLGDCDLVFLCSPQSKIIEDLDEIAKIIAKPEPNDKKPFASSIITDVASTKAKIAQKAIDLGLTNFVPGHPMAGTEKEGYQASFPELFEGSKWVLTEKSERTKILEYLIRNVLKVAETVLLDPVSHDKFVASVSHLPMLLSFALLDLLDKEDSTADIVGPGFRGMTRLAQGNIEMSKEILAINRANIKDLWREYSKNIETLLDTPASLLGDELSRIKKLSDKFDAKKELEKV